jgi:hypothetical protein
VGFFRALSFYPRLKNVTLHFNEVLNPKLAHEARPFLKNFLVPKSKAEYSVLISEVSDLTGTLHKNLSYPARIGALAHELAHIDQYHAWSKPQLAKFALEYTVGEALYRLTGDADKDLRTKYELKTDEHAIRAGAGPYVIQWKKEAYALYAKDGRGHLYMSVDEAKNCHEFFQAFP